MNSPPMTFGQVSVTFNDLAIDCRFEGILTPVLLLLLPPFCENEKTQQVSSLSRSATLSDVACFPSNNSNSAPTSETALLGVESHSPLANNNQAEKGRKAASLQSEAGACEVCV